ncbi:hypothetical protein [Streptomyces sp. NPDC047097]|uniref:hypothetical protein n=1 Tax=Streptomyces sp. NPDC047097 TaxID=3155260 RepID=UPI0033FF92CB
MVSDPHGREVLVRPVAARMELGLAVVSGPYELPVCAACLWPEDHPVVFAGAGHPAPGPRRPGR